MSKRASKVALLEAVEAASDRYARTQDESDLASLRAAAASAAEAGASIDAISKATVEGFERGESSRGDEARTKPLPGEVGYVAKYMRGRFGDLRGSYEIFSLIFDGKFSDDWTARHRVEVWLVNDFAYRRMPSILNDQSEQVQRSLRSILGDNAKVAGFVSNVVGTFSTKWSGWQQLSDTERRMKDVLEAAARLTEDKETLAKAGVTAEQATKVQRVLREAAEEVLQTVSAAEAAAARLAPGFVEKIRSDPPTAT